MIKIFVMKNILINIILIFGFVFINSCKKDVLNRSPLIAIGESQFFKTPNDLRIYVNQFYNTSNLPLSFVLTGFNSAPYPTDNIATSNQEPIFWGLRVLDNAGGISFDAVRNINYFFENYKRVEEGYSLNDYKQYLGEAYFFKAVIYFNLLKSYGDIPWLDEVPGTSSPLLDKPRDSRSLVADSIIACLDNAASFLTPSKTSGASRINKWMALLIQSRVALFEGTWEKYHSGDPFGVTNSEANKYLNKAADAAAQIINSGVYSVYNTGHPASDYYDLFIMRDYSTNPEVMLWKNNDNDIGKGNAGFANAPNYYAAVPRGITITKEFADSYLCTDGKPISVSPVFMGHNSLTDEAKNRDPRFRQTIATPEDVWFIRDDGSIESYYDELYNKLLNNGDEYKTPTGYVIRKRYDARRKYQIPTIEGSPIIVFRYAEALLNYAEAKAELNTLTQNDIDISIKKLRDRAGMPNLDLSNIANDPNWDFPELSPIINEIRRERRVELVTERFRYDDIRRWAAADELIVGKRPKGFKASQIHLPATNPFAVDADGFLDPLKASLPNGFGFKLDRDYLNPIPKTEITLNPALTQNPGWK
jgi:hypothetical protein